MSCALCSLPARIASVLEKRPDVSLQVSDAMLELAGQYSIDESCRVGDLVHYTCWYARVNEAGLSCSWCAEPVVGISGKHVDACIISGTLYSQFIALKAFKESDINTSVLHKRCLLRMRTKLTPNVSHSSRIRVSSAAPSAAETVAVVPPSPSSPAPSTVHSIEQERDFAAAALRLSMEVEELSAPSSAQLVALQRLRSSIDGIMHAVAPMMHTAASSNIMTTPHRPSLASAKRSSSEADLTTSAQPKRAKLEAPSPAKMAEAAVHVVKAKTRLQLSGYRRWQLVLPLLDLDPSSEEYRREWNRILIENVTNNTPIIAQTLTRTVAYVKRYRAWFQDRVDLAKGNEITLKRLLSKTQMPGAGRKSTFSEESRNILFERIEALRASPEATLVDTKLFVQIAKEIDPASTIKFSYDWVNRIFKHLGLSRRKVTTTKNINEAHIKAAANFYLLRFPDLVELPSDIQEFVAEWRAAEAAKEGDRAKRLADERAKAAAEAEEAAHRELDRVNALPDAERAALLREREQAAKHAVLKAKMSARAAQARKAKKEAALRAGGGRIWRHQCAEGWPPHRVINADETSVVLEDHGNTTVDKTGTTSVSGTPTSRDTVTGFLAVTMNGKHMTPTIVSQKAASTAKSEAKKAEHNATLNRITLHDVKYRDLNTMEEVSNRAASMCNVKAYMTEEAVIEWLRKIIRPYIQWLDSDENPFGDKDRVFASKPGSNHGCPEPAPLIRLLLLWDNMGAHCTDKVSNLPASPASVFVRSCVCAFGAFACVALVRIIAADHVSRPLIDCYHR